MSSFAEIVVFDIGNVLIEWDPDHLYRKLIPDEADRARFLQDICSMDWNLQQDLGRSWTEAIDQLVRAHPDQADLIAAYSERWHEMVPGAISGTVDILLELKASGVPLYAITNFSSDKFAETQERFPFLKQSFLDILVSGDEGMIKPDIRIYETFLSRNNLAPGACVFIDDSPNNVEGARRSGMNALHFTSPDVLRTDLRSLGFPV
ncbi:HAD family hydrolase [Roseibium sp.]|uniref:HAD family hydrolase n=1 Tax=Roseibium sp. TaxID=1936156 RepID=UPI003A97CD7A